jgi:predicted dehydrogenase
MDSELNPGRRDLLKSAGAVFTTSLFASKLKGANDRIAMAFIGMGRMGMANLGFALKMPTLEVTAVCDCYQPHLEEAVAKTGSRAKGVQDFREILADRSVDAVCISTPDHWHAYMAVEACKAGKDVFVEKPICCAVEEGRKMVDAARKYKRVVQAGTMQRSGVHFQKAAGIVKSGQLGTITFVRTWNYGLHPQEGIGNPPDSDPPPGLDWDMWLGPAPARPFNQNRFGVDPKAFSHFRWFWDYAGGMMTDWGVHWLDIVQMAFDEAVPKAATALGGKYYLTDNRETPDTLQVTYEYPDGLVATYENRYGNGQSMFQKGGGILFHGSKGTLFVDRSGYRLIPEKESDLQPAEGRRSNDMNMAHWENWLECVKSRETPVSDIETCHRSTTTCLLGNVALRSGLRIDWDAQSETTAQKDARRFLKREYRKPWKLSV